MGGFLLLGFFIGMQHALEVDHLAAVSAMAAGKPGSRKHLALRGAAWGLGHTLTLFAISAAVIGLGYTLTGRAAAALEFSVGVMLLLLGADVLRRMWQKRVHFHAHSHDDTARHIHAHGHQNAAAPHASDAHGHAHAERFPKRAVLVGLMHGAAGSAGLMALAVAATQSAASALSYVAAFGIGSIVGMAVLSYAVAWPLNALQKNAAWVWNALSVAAGIAAIAVGVGIMLATFPAMNGSS